MGASLCVRRRAAFRDTLEIRNLSIFFFFHKGFVPWPEISVMNSTKMGMAVSIGTEQLTLE